MSWKTINHILGLAAVDQHFWLALQKDPLTAIETQGFVLSPEEQAVLSRITAKTLPEFSQRLLDELPADSC